MQSPCEQASLNALSIQYRTLLDWSPATNHLLHPATLWFAVAGPSTSPFYPQWGGQNLQYHCFQDCCTQMWRCRELVCLLHSTSIAHVCVISMLQLWMDSSSISTMSREIGSPQTERNKIPMVNVSPKFFHTVVGISPTIYRTQNPLLRWQSIGCRWIIGLLLASGLLTGTHNHQVLGIRLNASYPLFGDVVVVHRFLKKPPGFEDRTVIGVCLSCNPTASEHLVVSL